VRNFRETLFFLSVVRPRDAINDNRDGVGSPFYFLTSVEITERFGIFVVTVINDHFTTESVALRWSDEENTFRTTSSADQCVIHPSRVEICFSTTTLYRTGFFFGGNPVHIYVRVCVTLVDHTLIIITEEFRIKKPGDSTWKRTGGSWSAIGFLRNRYLLF